MNKLKTLLFGIIITILSVPVYGHGRGGWRQGAVPYTTYHDQAYVGGTPVAGTGHIYVVGKDVFFIDTDGTASSMIQPDQNLYETVTGDSGSTTANTTTDSLAIAGGVGISTLVSPDTVTISNPAWNGTFKELFDAGELDSGTAAVPVVINTDENTITLLDQLRADVDAVGTDTTHARIQVELQRIE